MTETQVHTRQSQAYVASDADADTEEIITFCPGCKAFQTLWLHHGRLVLTRKYTQKNNQVYHDCGASRPCRLYRTTHNSDDVQKEHQSSGKSF